MYKYLNSYGIPQTRESKIYVDNTLTAVSEVIVTGDMLFCKRHGDVMVTTWKALKGATQGIFVESRKFSINYIHEEFIPLELPERYEPFMKIP